MLCIWAVFEAESDVQPPPIGREERTLFVWGRLQVICKLHEGALRQSSG